MTMISYAQNGEDVVLGRLFKNQLFGRYIDIGAADPVIDSVTKHFYDLGWRGVNVEPDPRFAARLEDARPGDVNLRVAVSARAGKAALHVATDSHQGLSTLDSDDADRILGTHQTIIEVATITLEMLFEQCADGPVDFLKVDVEGHEREVLAGANWELYRPRVLVIEATEPNSTVPCHDRWEPMLLSVGYRCALFDGLNRFYASEDDLEARAALSAPANVTDGFVRRDFAEQSSSVEQLTLSVAESSKQAVEFERRVIELEAALAESRLQVAEFERRVSELEQVLASDRVERGGPAAVEGGLLNQRRELSVGERVDLQ